MDRDRQPGLQILPSDTTYTAVGRGQGGLHSGVCVDDARLTPAVREQLEGCESSWTDALREQLDGRHPKPPKPSSCSSPLQHLEDSERLGAGTSARELELEGGEDSDTGASARDRACCAFRWRTRKGVGSAHDAQVAGRSDGGR